MDILACPVIFRGWFEGKDLVLRLGLEVGKGWESGRLVVTVRVRGWGIHYGYECPQKDRGMCVCERERVREMSWARLVFKQASAVFLHQFM